MKKLNSLRALYIRALNDLYDAEHQLLQMLPRLANAASCEDLRMHFETQVDHTQSHVRRLESVFAQFGESPARRICKAMKGILEAADDMMQAEGNSAIKDAGLISVSQHVEHFEMVGYGCARAYAEKLGDEGSAELLQETLNDARATDEGLTALADRLIERECVAA